MQAKLPLLTTDARVVHLKPIKVRHGGDELVQPQPLACKVLGESAATVIIEHAAHLGLKHLGVAQFTLTHGSHQGFIRDAAPEKQRQALCQLIVTSQCHLTNAILGFHHVDKLW